MSITSATGAFSELVVARLHPGTDLIEGITALCRQHGIQSGSILTCIGSLRRAAFLVVKPMDNRLGGGYSEPISLPGPVELVSSQGTIGQNAEGALFIHLHGAVSDSAGLTRGGHLIAGACPVLITCEVLIGRHEGLEASHRHDEEVAMKVLVPVRRE